MAKRFFMSGAVGYGDGAWQPSADIYQVEDEWILRLELAGVSPDDIEVTVKDSVLTVAGVRRDVQIPLGCNMHVMEIPFSRFRRSFSFPFDLHSSDIRTEYNYGMLLIRILPGVEK